MLYAHEPVYTQTHIYNTFIVGVIPVAAVAILRKYEYLIKIRWQLFRFQTVKKSYKTAVVLFKKSSTSFFTSA